MNAKYLLILLIIGVIIAFSCNKTSENPTGTNKIEIDQTTIDSISYYTAKVSTNITDLGGNQITQHGHCWGINPKPTIEENKTTLGKLTLPKTYTSELSGLKENTTYFIRAYVAFNENTVYHDEQNIQTLETGKPIVITGEISNITTTSASCTFTNDDGGLTLIARGICWNTSGNPTLQNNTGFTEEGSGTGSETSQLTGLTENTNYYITAYATNEKGTNYGEVQSFSTLAPCGELTINYHGQTYHTVQIGEQCWFKENLNYETGNSWCYDNDPTNCATYGRLYTWETLMNGEVSSNSVPSGVQGICPPGWHIPSDDEWKILEGNTDSLYGVDDPKWDETGYRGYDAGKRIKSTFGWNSNGNGTDDYGLSMFPGGYCYLHSNEFFYAGEIGNWWSATEYNPGYAYYRGLSCYSEDVMRHYSLKARGRSVRCLKD